MADLPGGQPHRGAGDGRLANIEGRATAADPSAHRHQSGFGAAQKLGLGGQTRLVPQARDLIGFGMRQRRHQGFPPGLLARFLSSHGIAPCTAYNLSIDIDNYTNYTYLLTGVHDGWMTGPENCPGWRRNGGR
ncbi:hypothetical protein MPLA_1620014 [Mesorhizobium sp. ORS 3359]|nr:hypothetical protein MPLA_1620014 [Mesorhizobium sp. ORS 3359]